MNYSLISFGVGVVVGGSVAALAPKLWARVRAFIIVKLGGKVE